MSKGQTTADTAPYRYVHVPEPYALDEEVEEIELEVLQALREHGGVYFGSLGEQFTSGPINELRYWLAAAKEKPEPLPPEPPEPLVWLKPCVTDLGAPPGGYRCDTSQLPPPGGNEVVGVHSLRMEQYLLSLGYTNFHRLYE